LAERGRGLMECQYCGDKIDGEAHRIKARNLEGFERYINDVYLCPDGVNENYNCTSEYFDRLKKFSALLNRKFIDNEIQNQRAQR
jgi:hypothetical protein